MDDRLKKFSKYLSEYKAVEIENGVEVAWGHNIIGQLGPTLWEELKKVFKPRGVSGFGFGSSVKYHIVTKELTHEEAVAMLGPFTKEVRGPQGGFKSIAFGDKTFYNRALANPNYKRVKIL